jgi:hypothetical protein
MFKPVYCRKLGVGGHLQCMGLLSACQYQAKREPALTSQDLIATVCKDLSCMVTVFGQILREVAPLIIEDQRPTSVLTLSHKQGSVVNTSNEYQFVFSVKPGRKL